MEKIPDSTNNKKERPKNIGAPVVALLMGALAGYSLGEGRRQGEFQAHGENTSLEIGYDESGYVGSFSDTVPLSEGRYKPLLDNLVLTVNGAFGKTWPTNEQRTTTSYALRVYTDEFNKVTADPSRPSREEVLKGLAVIALGDVRINPEAVGTLLQEIAIQIADPTDSSKDAAETR